MEDVQRKVIDWLKTLRGWQCELAYRILTKHQLDNIDIDEILCMLKEEKQFGNKDFPNIGISIDREPNTLNTKIKRKKRKQKQLIILIHRYL